MKNYKIDFSNSPGHLQALVDYVEAPIVMDAKSAIEQGLLIYHDNGEIEFNIQNIKSDFYKESIMITPFNQFDLLLPTLMGLNDSLVQAEAGSSFRTNFESEFSSFYEIVGKEGNYNKYGTYVFKPDNLHLIHFAPKYWHKLSLLASNAQLISDPKFEKSWEEIRSIFQLLAPAVAGASVGSKIADTIIKVIRPDEITISDHAVYKLTNANRTDIAYDDIVISKGFQNKLSEQSIFYYNGMQNKAVSFAKRIQKIDPYITIYPLSKGITKGNVEEFVKHSNIVVEEIDLSYDIEAKVFIREEARKQQKMFIMLSDLGSSIQWDIRPFHLNPNIPLVLDVTDSNLYKINIEAKYSQDNFFKFLDAILGKHLWESGEFALTLNGKLPKIISSMPQLGSTTSVAGGIAAEFIARMVLDFNDIPERGILDLRTFTIKLFGKRIGELI